jgi:hypothetical protein
MPYPFHKFLIDFFAEETIAFLPITNRGLAERVKMGYAIPRSTMERAG